MDCLEKRQHQPGNFNVYLELSSSTNFSANIFCAFLCAPTKSPNVFSLSCPPPFLLLEFITWSGVFDHVLRMAGFYICVFCFHGIFIGIQALIRLQKHILQLSWHIHSLFSPMANPKINCDFADNHPKYQQSVKLPPCLVYDTTIFKIL